MYFIEWQQTKCYAEFAGRFSFMVSKREILVTKEIPIWNSPDIFFLQKLHRHQFKEALMGCVAFEMTFLCVFILTCLGFFKDNNYRQSLIFPKTWWTKCLFFRAERAVIGQSLKIETRHFVFHITWKCWPHFQEQSRIRML